MRELDWFDGPEQDGDNDRPPRRRWLLPLAAIPWLVVVALLVLPNLGDDATPDGGATPADTVDATTGHDGADRATTPAASAGEHDHDAAHAHDDDHEHEHDHEHDPSSPPQDTPTGVSTTIEVEELRGRWRVAAGAEEAAALAVVVARGWLTGLGPVLDVGGATPPENTYAEHLVIEAVEHPSPDTAVVTVLAVVLEDQGGDTGEVGVRRLAVPIVLPEDGPRPGGRPWELPAPELAPHPVDLQTVEDPVLTEAAADALAHAGLDALEVVELATATGWPTVAVVTDGTEEHRVWLRPHLDGYVVAGTTLAGAGMEQP